MNLRKIKKIEFFLLKLELKISSNVFIRLKLKMNNKYLDLIKESNHGNYNIYKKWIKLARTYKINGHSNK
jgi:hypothetical protein